MAEKNVSKVKNVVLVGQESPRLITIHKSQSADSLSLLLSHQLPGKIHALTCLMHRAILTLWVTPIRQ